MKDKYIFTLDFNVRDYELDLQGIVNNSVYQNYLEHTRHEFLKAAGSNFAMLHEQGIDAVVTRLELNFKRPLKSNDAFWIGLNWEPKGRTQIVFFQDIYCEDLIMLNAKVFVACVQGGRVIIPESILSILKSYK